MDGGVLHAAERVAGQRAFAVIIAPQRDVRIGTRGEERVAVVQVDLVAEPFDALIVGTMPGEAGAEHREQVVIGHQVLGQGPGVQLRGDLEFAHPLVEAVLRVAEVVALGVVDLIPAAQRIAVPFIEVERVCEGRLAKRCGASDAVGLFDHGCGRAGQDRDLTGVSSHERQDQAGTAQINGVGRSPHGRDLLDRVRLAQGEVAVQLRDKPLRMGGVVKDQPVAGNRTGAFAH